MFNFVRVQGRRILGLLNCLNSTRIDTYKRKRLTKYFFKKTYKSLVELCAKSGKEITAILTRVKGPLVNVCNREPDSPC